MIKIKKKFPPDPDPSAGEQGRIGDKINGWLASFNNPSHKKKYSKGG